MSKPEDMKQEVWEAAEAVWRDDLHMANDRFGGVEAIASAILAAEKRGEEREREACAQFIFNAPAVVEHPAGPLYGAGFSAAVQMMCAAIRARSTP